MFQAGSLSLKKNALLLAVCCFQLIEQGLRILVSGQGNAPGVGFSAVELLDYPIEGFVNQVFFVGGEYVAPTFPTRKTCPGNSSQFCKLALGYIRPLTAKLPLLRFAICFVRTGAAA